MRTPALGVAVIAPLILVGAVGASAPSPSALVSEAAVTPLAAVEPPPGQRSGAAVVAITRTPTAFHIAAANVSAPPPAVVVNSPGTLRIPAMALTAYRNAERMMAAAYPGCGVSWNLLAGIGRIESMHANGGATDARGTAVRPIYGPALDGSLPGNEIIVQSRSAERVTYARAMGPMQFLPGTWSRYASDGDGDGKAEVQNLFDSTLAAARYLCSGGLNLRDQSHVMAAILRYNNSMAYARNVLGWAGAYATGVVPVDLPPITGPVPPLGDAHLESPEGLGPGLPINAIGLPRQRPTGADPAGRQAHRRRRPDPDEPARLRPRPDARPPARAAAGTAGAGPAAGAAAVDTAVVAAAAARLRGVLPGREHPGSGATDALPPGIGALPGAPPAPASPPLFPPAPPPLFAPPPPPLFPPPPPPLFAPPPPFHRRHRFSHRRHRFSHRRHRFSLRRHRPGRSRWARRRAPSPDRAPRPRSRRPVESAYTRR